MMLNVACELQPYSLVPENQRKNLNCQVSKGIIWHTGEVIYVQITISNLPADFWTKQPHEFPTCPFHTLLCYDIGWLGSTVKWSFLNIRFSQTKGSGKTESYRNILTIHFQRHQFKILTIQHQGRMATCDPKKKLLYPLVLIKQLKDLFDTEEYKFACNIVLQNKLSPEVGTTRILDETSVFSSPSSNFRSTCTISRVGT